MYHIQISQSEVYPEGDGKFNLKGIDSYDKLINAMLKRGIEPMICLYHFDMPLHLAKEYNGFMSKRVVDTFVRFGEEMIDHFSDRVKYWIVFNEYSLYFQDEVFNISDYERNDKTLDDMYTIFHHTMINHTRLASYIHGKYDDMEIGGMLAYQQVYPGTSKATDIWVAKQTQEFLNFSIYDVDTGHSYSPEVIQYAEDHHINWDITGEDREEIKKTQADFLAFSYYSSQTLSADKIPEDIAPNCYMNYGGIKSEYLKTNAWGWTINPLGSRNAITMMYNHYRIPVFPIENGTDLKETWDGEHIVEDNKRIAYHEEHIKAMEDAMFLDGAKVLGHLGWRLIDIPSSHADVEKRCGAVYVNRSNHDLKDLKCVPKKSFYWSQKVLKNNGDGI